MPDSITKMHAADGPREEMEKLIAELMRLFVTAGALPPELLARRLLGQDTQPLSLVTAEGVTRAVAIAFDKTPESGEAGHWTRLCEAANALQGEHGFPAPAVSVSGGKGYSLWISLASPVPLVQARQFADLVRQSYLPEAERDPEEPMANLPPCLNEATGKWAAFIHPGMGASFADEPWLDMTPPPLAQAGFLEDVQSVGPVQFARALATLQGAGAAAPAGAAPTPPPSCGGVLLKDATLEDIVRHLHGRNIEPTFRHLLPGQGR